MVLYIVKQQINCDVTMVLLWIRCWTHVSETQADKATVSQSKLRAWIHKHIQVRKYVKILKHVLVDDFNIDLPCQCDSCDVELYMTNVNVCDLEKHLSMYWFPVQIMLLIFVSYLEKLVSLKDFISRAKYIEFTSTDALLTHDNFILT